MRESLYIIFQCLDFLFILNKQKDFSYISEDFKYVSPSRFSMRYTMESLIHHFKLYTEGVIISEEEIYSVVEAPKGEFGTFLVSILLIGLIVAV